VGINNFVRRDQEFPSASVAETVLLILPFVVAGSGKDSMGVVYSQHGDSKRPALRRRAFRAINHLRIQRAFFTLRERRDACGTCADLALRSRTRLNEFSSPINRRAQCTALRGTRSPAFALTSNAGIAATEELSRQVAVIPMLPLCAPPAGLARTLIELRLEVSVSIVLSSGVRSKPDFSLSIRYVLRSLALQLSF